MHIPDGVFEAPVIVATLAIGGMGLGYASYRLKDQLRERTVALMGSMAAFVFAAQMVNFPLYPLPISGHLFGGVLAAVLLGPWAGAGVIASVLLVQCLLFQDGGLTALGANFINMGLIGSVVGYAIYASLRRLIGGQKGILIGAMLASWFAVILASGAFVLELAASGTQIDFLRVLGWMTLIHAGIGVGEALITGLVLRMILLTRPDLVDETARMPTSHVIRWGQLAVGGLAIATAVVIFLAPFASTHPDGLEYLGGELKFLGAGARSDALTSIPDDHWPGIEQYAGLGSSIAGLGGTLIVFGAGASLGRVFTRSKNQASFDGL